MLARRKHAHVPSTLLLAALILAVVALFALAARAPRPPRAACHSSHSLYDPSGAEGSHETERSREPEPLDERTSTIFVSVPSYRDVQCAATIESMIRSAAYPGRVFIGVYEQNKQTKPNEPTESCAVPTDIARLAGGIRTVTVGHEKARGPCAARYQCAQLMRGESLYLQVDSHTVFADRWDVTAIAMLRAVPRAESGGVVISTYAADCRENAWQEAAPPIINTATHNGDHFVFSAVQSPNARQPRGAPSRQIGGGFLLCVADVIRRVPLDPELDGIFAGEETLYTARLFSHGTDVLSPKTNLLCHRYAYAGHRAVWDDSDVWTRGTGGYDRLHALLRGTHPDMYGPYGFGRVRTLDDFWKSVKISYRNNTAEPWP
jgi:hypothetical protein